MASDCYCCSSEKSIPTLKNDAKETELSLNAALQELGMLSSVTNCRTEYLKELNENTHLKMCSVELPKGSDKFGSLSDSSLCVPTKKPLHAASFSFDPMAVENNEYNRVLSARYERSKLRKMRRDHKFRPYEFPWRAKLEESIRELSSLSLQTVPTTTITTSNSSSKPPSLHHQDSGNRSNPGSPVKNQKITSNTGCSIFRSKSLDNLDLCEMSGISEKCSDTPEIDTVSQRIKNLHFS